LKPEGKLRLQRGIWTKMTFYWMKIRSSQSRE
jgi:hypothetical protein